MTKITSAAHIPPGLKKGDHIGLVMPAGPLADGDDFDLGIDFVTQAGYRIKHYNLQTKRQNYLAGSDSERAASFCRIWQDPEVKAVLAVRGGYGSIRMLPYLDLAIFRRQPKIFIGFSDITTLLNTFASQAGFVSFHGPMLTTLSRSNQAAQDSFLQTLKNPEQVAISAPGVEIVTPGMAHGRLFGGNLTTLAHLIATPYDLDWRDSILFLEDIGEAPYRVDRMLTQLQLAGRLPELAGVILGSFTDANMHDIQGRELIQQRILELTGGRIPLWANFPTGHGPANLTLPIGREVIMDDKASTLLPGNQ